MSTVGIPGEIKADERRIAITPAGARELVRDGHHVIVERGAGSASGFPDAAYVAAGADLANVERVYADAELIVKVKEPQPEEVARLSPGHTLFAYLPLAAEPALARELAASGARCIAYETVEDAAGGLPLLAP